MSYSRYLESMWYTYWLVASDDFDENRDTAAFCVFGVAKFTASELRKNIEACLDSVKAKSVKLNPSEDDMLELKGYMLEFLSDVDAEYGAEVAS